MIVFRELSDSCRELTDVKDTAAKEDKNDPFLPYFVASDPIFELPISLALPLFFKFLFFKEVDLNQTYSASPQAFRFR